MAGGGSAMAGAGILGGAAIGGIAAYKLGTMGPEHEAERSRRMAERMEEGYKENVEGQEKAEHHYGQISGLQRQQVEGKQKLEEHARQRDISREERLDRSRERDLDRYMREAGKRQEVDETGLTGKTVEGNINLHQRPSVHNPDGSISTVRSMSFEENGQEVLVPTVRKGLERPMTNEEAIEHYHKTGEHLGKFATPETATAYAKRLHESQEKEYTPYAHIEEGLAARHASSQKLIDDQQKRVEAAAKETSAAEANVKAAEEKAKATRQTAAQNEATAAIAGQRAEEQSGLWAATKGAVAGGLAGGDNAGGFVQGAISGVSQGWNREEQLKQRAEATAQLSKGSTEQAGKAEAEAKAAGQGQEDALKKQQEETEKLAEMKEKQAERDIQGAEKYIEKLKEMHEQHLKNAEAIEKGRRSLTISMGMEKPRERRKLEKAVQHWQAGTATNKELALVAEKAAPEVRDRVEKQLEKKMEKDNPSFAKTEQALGWGKDAEKAEKGKAAEDKKRIDEQEKRLEGLRKAADESAASMSAKVGTILERLFKMQSERFAKEIDRVYQKLNQDAMDSHHKHESQAASSR
jgi:hypothetical protein